MEMADGMKSITDNIAASSEERSKAMRNLMSDTRETLKRAARERKGMSKEQAKGLSDYARNLAHDVEDMLKGFRMNRKKMSKGQAQDLSNFAKKLSADTDSMLSRFKKEEGRMSEELRERLGSEVKAVKTYVRKRLKEFDRAHSEMSNTVEKSLTQYANDLVGGVGKLLSGHSSEMKKARGAWLNMSRELNGTRAAAASASRNTGGKRAAAAIKEAKKTESPIDVGKKILRFIKSHPEGVKVSDMEAPLGVVRTKLGVLAKGLLEEGKVRKEENLYFPLLEKVGL